MSNSTFLLPGTRLMKGKYNIAGVLGQGRLGITYLAIGRTEMAGNNGSLHFEERVAIKEFYLRDFSRRNPETGVVETSGNSVVEAYRDKFRQAAIDYNSLVHPGIVRVVDVFEGNGTTYFAMEFVEGQSLTEYISQKGCLPEKEALNVLREIAEPLEYMHAKGILHLGLHPDAIMRKFDGSYIIVDFELTKAIGPDGQPESSTNLGTGIAGYAPLEQNSHRGGVPLAANVDVYALGAILFSMLTGRRPPLPADILNQGFPVDELKAHNVSTHTIGVLTKAMSPAGKSRYQTVGEFVSALTNRVELPPAISVPPIPVVEPEKDEEPGSEEENDSSEPVDDDTEARFDNLSETRKQRRFFKGVGWVIFIVAILVVLGVNIWKNSDGVFSAETDKPKYENEGERLAAEGKIDEAVAWWKTAAEEGDASAMASLGDCYLSGEGVHRDKRKGIEWTRKSAELGNPAAQNNLGICYNEAYGVKKNYKEALKWFRMAADQGYVDAQYNVGVYYEKGYGVAKDASEAVEWFRKAAEQGYAAAQFNLGTCYLKGVGVTKDMSEGVEWFRKAAEQGFADAQYNLGVCYQRGLGVTTDTSKAVEWYQLAAEQNQLDALTNLGVFYYFGIGVKQDREYGIKLIRTAVAMGSKNAKETLKKLGIRRR